MTYEPATSVINAFAGADGIDDPVKAVATILSCPASRIRMWRREKGSNGTGGLIPHKYIPELLAAAARLGIDLQPGDFVTPLRLQAKKAA